LTDLHFWIWHYVPAGNMDLELEHGPKVPKIELSENSKEKAAEFA